MRLSVRLPQPKSKLNYYRDIAVLAFPTPAGERHSLEGFRIQEWKGKAGFARVNRPPLDSREVKPDDVIARGKIVDLSTRMDAAGKLDWQVPEGDWTIVRFGHTSTGATNHPAPPEGQGLECDKMSTAGADLAWQNTMQKVIDDAGPLVGKTFTSVLSAELLQPVRLCDPESDAEAPAADGPSQTAGRCPYCGSPCLIHLRSLPAEPRAPP